MKRIVRKLAVSLLAAVAAACAVPSAAPGPRPSLPEIVIQRTQPGVDYTPIELDLVQAMYATAPLAHAVQVGRAEIATREGATPDSILMKEVRTRAARQGGTMVTWRRVTPYTLEFIVFRDPVIARLSDQRLAARQDSAARGLGRFANGASVPAASGASTSSSSGGGSSGGCTGSCSVHVRGYTRKDGTYVRPHTRSAPGRGGRRH